MNTKFFFFMRRECVKNNNDDTTKAKKQTVAHNCIFVVVRPTAVRRRLRAAETGRRGRLMVGNCGPGRDSRDFHGRALLL